MKTLSIQRHQFYLSICCQFIYRILEVNQWILDRYLIIVAPLNQLLLPLEAQQMQEAALNLAVDLENLTKVWNL